MTDLILPLLSAGIALVLVLQIVVLLRKSRIDLPAELTLKLAALEQSARATLQAVAKNDGALEGVSQQLRGFTQATASSLESVRHAMDAKLAQTVAESRQGRTELLTAFQGFEGKLEQRLSGFDASLSQRLDAVQATVSTRLDETSKGLLAHLAQAQSDAATNRKELGDALAGFRAELASSVAALSSESVKSREAVNESGKLFEARIQERFETLQASTGASLEASRQAVDDKLGQTVAESRQGRAELLTAFQGFEGKLEKRLGGFDATLAQRMEALQLAVSVGLDDTSKTLLKHLGQAQTDAATGRKELTDALGNFRGELGNFRLELGTALASLAAESVKSRQAMLESAALFEVRIQERFETLTGATRQTLDSLKTDINTQLGVMSGALKDQLEGNSSQIKHQFSALQESVSQQLAGLVQGSQQNAEQLRVALNERLAAIQLDNTTK